MSLNEFLSQGSQSNDGSMVPPWEGLGIEIVLLVAEAPTPQEAVNFRAQYGLDHLYIAVDDYSMMPPDALTTPVMQLVDPRTMEIVRRGEGVKWDFRDAAVNLAIENGS